MGKLGDGLLRIICLQVSQAEAQLTNGTQAKPLLEREASGSTVKADLVRCLCEQCDDVVELHQVP